MARMIKEAAAGTQALDRALTLLAAIAAEGETTGIAALARAQSLPLSTAHRLVARLEAHGLVVRAARGQYRAGLALARLAANANPRATAAAVARPLLRRLVRRTGRTAHLGLLEAEMVTYLVKEAPSGARMFTREAMQLEAYGSAIGKVLLAALSAPARERYLGPGGFVALTPSTRTDPAALRAHLAEIAAAGFARDEEEVAPGLACLAVPVPVVDGLPSLAISISGAPQARDGEAALLAMLNAAAAALAAVLTGRRTLP